MTDWVFINVATNGFYEDLIAFRSLMFGKHLSAPGVVEEVVDFEQIIPLSHRATLQQKLSCWGCEGIGSNLHIEETERDHFDPDSYEFKFRFDTPLVIRNPSFEH